jgi:hypothetical protein
MESRGRRGRRRGPRDYRNSYTPENRYNNEPVLKKPSFSKVSQIIPEMTGINLKLKVTKIDNAAPSEVLMGDDTGSVLVIVNKQAVFNRLQEGSSVFIRNGFVEMKQDTYIQITTNEWGKIEISEETFEFEVKKGNNISEVEYAIE